MGRSIIVASEKAAIAEIGIENGEISIEGFQARYRAFTVDQKKCAIIGIFSRKLQDAARYAIQQDFSLVEAEEYWKEQERSVREENLSDEILDEETIDKLIDCEYDTFREKIEPNLLKEREAIVMAKDVELAHLKDELNKATTELIEKDLEKDQQL